MRTDTFSMRPQRGFSLIEVLVAVVILSTGLLALAALQGSLTKASADAKVRSQVASLLQGRMDQLRTVGYDAAVTMTDTCATNAGATNGTDFVTQAFCNQNGLGAMSVTQTVTTWTGAVGAATFGVGVPASADAPQFKRVVLSATWTDANGATNRRLAVSSDLSALGLKDTIVPPPESSNVGGQTPIVRQASPATAGVIPIAMGGNDATAATNPRPEVLGRNNNQSIVGTTFNVLTYTNESSNTARIQRRVENSLIRCKCEYGGAGVGFASLPPIYRQPQWPAVWTGERYEIFKPDPAAAAPGTSFRSAPVANETQSELCTECCRDHHDTSLVLTDGRFDPLRTDGVGKYGIDNQGQLTNTPVNTNNGVYVNACRVIRVDGFWRTASDTYARQFGLLATETVALRPAANGVPAASTATSYQTFVKDYLAVYDGGGSNVAIPAAGLADTMFNQAARGLNNPASITINRPIPKDERYLHSRGLYVDRLVTKAREKLAYELNNCTSTPRVECILPYLPFTTINTTELAFWRPVKNGGDSNSEISVATGSSLIFDPLLPTRGRVNAVNAATNGVTADALAELTPSNSGLAISSTGVDPQDAVDLADKQAFLVSAPNLPGAGGKFNVVITGLPQTGDSNTSNDPAVAYTVGVDAGNCVSTIAKNDNDPNPYVCNTNVTLPVPSATALIANYWREVTVNVASSTVIPASQCLYNGSPVTIASTTVPVPAFENNQVTSATVTGGAATIGLAVNDGKKSETTLITLVPLANNATLALGFSLQGGAPTRATFVSCTANYIRVQGTFTYVLGTVTWAKPWDLP